MEAQIARYKPDFWINGQGTITITHAYVDYNSIIQDLSNAVQGGQISTIKRNQDLIKYGQYLVRQQLLEHEGQYEYYKVRRFVVIPRDELECAIKYNLDGRRLSFYVNFKSTIRNLPKNSMVLVVMITTNNPDNDNIVPERSDDYFIEYIVDYN